MFNDLQKFKRVLFFLFFLQLMVWTIISIAGCSKSENTPPTNNLTIGKVTLTWQDVPNATSYNIYYSSKPGVTKKNGIKISNVKNPHEMDGLKKGVKYYFVVTAVNDSGESKESEEISFTVGQ